MPGPRVAVVGAGAWGTTLARVVAAEEPVTLAVPLPGDGGTDRRDRAQRGAPAGHRPAADGIPTADPRRSRDATDLVIFADARPRTCARPSRLSRPYLAPEADLLSVVKGLESRNAAADERGRRRGGAASPPARIAALSGPNLAAEVARNLPASAVVAAADLALARTCRGAGRPTAVPAVRERGHPRRRAVRCAQERDRHRGGGRGRPRLRRQRQGRAADARSRRDDPARDRGRREPAHVRRAGRDGRPDRDVRLAPVAQPSARRGARQGPHLGRYRGDTARDRRRRLHGPGGSRPGGALRRRDADRPRGRRALFEGKSVQRCLVDLLARETKDELADYDRWVARSRSGWSRDRRLPSRTRSVARQTRC